MKNFVEAAQFAFAALGGALGAVLGGFDGFLYALIAFVLVDYLTGVMVAVVNKKLSSEVGFKGIFKKVVIFALGSYRAHHRHLRDPERERHPDCGDLLLPVQ